MLDGLLDGKRDDGVLADIFAVPAVPRIGGAELLSPITPPLQRVQPRLLGRRIT